MVVYSVEQQRKIRTDAVYCVEILLSASPEYFRPDDPSQYGYYQANKLDDWKQASQQWLQQEYGDRIVRAELHLDEATPHIHVYLVPTDEAGQLNCKKLFGGRAKMFAFQDSYAAATKHLGLERGVRDSQAEHTTVKEYYAVVNAASSGLEQENLQVLRTKAAAYEWMKREKVELEKRLKLLAQQRDLLAMELQKTQESIAAKAEIDRVIASQNLLISNDRVAVELKLNPHEIDPLVGVIDLVTDTLDRNLDGALMWLHEKFGAAATAQLVTHAARTIVDIPDRKFTPPDSMRSEWGDVRTYLTTEKSLPAKLVDRLYDEGLIDASEGGKLICLHRDFEGKTTGATEIDLKHKQLLKVLVEGSSLTSGFHYFEHDPLLDAECVVICDDPIEAMAYATLHVPDRPTLYLSAHEGDFVPGDRLSGIEIVLATDIKLQNLPTRFDRHIPTGNSWVSDLKSELALLTSGQIQIGERDDRQTRMIQEMQKELIESAQHKNSQQNPPLDRSRGGR